MTADTDGPAFTDEEFENFLASLSPAVESLLAPYSQAQTALADTQEALAETGAALAEALGFELQVTPVIALCLTESQAYAIATLIGHTIILPVEQANGTVTSPGTELIEVMKALEEGGINWFMSPTSQLIEEAGSVEFAAYPEGFAL